MKTYWLCIISLLILTTSYSQNYVYIGFMPTFSYKNINPYFDETKKIVTNQLDSVWNQNNFTINYKCGGMFSFGYKKAYSKGFSLNIGGEIGMSQLNLRKENIGSSIRLYSFGIPISIQKKINLNERLNFYVSATVGVTFLFSNYKMLYGEENAGINIYQHPNSVIDTTTYSYNFSYNISSSELYYARPVIGIQYKFKNKSYIEFGLGYNFQLRRNFSFSSKVLSSYHSPNNYFNDSKLVFSSFFKLSSLLAEVKYCIPLMPGRIKPKKIKDK